MTLLSVEGLSKSFGAVAAARSVSLAVARGERVALIGPNGAGKSTVFAMIGGQLRVDEGRVRLEGEDITRLSPKERFHRGIGRTFQVAQTFGSMTVVENVQMALMGHRREVLRLWHPARARHRDEAFFLLERVGLAEAGERIASTLAYGDVKRLELAMALASRPKLLLMDEPTAGMAGRERAGLMDLVSSLAASESLGVLFTEHDMDVVFGHASRILVLMRGEVIAEGTPEAVRADARVRQVYLGDTHDYIHALERAP